jgi:hypothetical protein
MRSKQTQIVLISIIIVLFAWIISPLLFSKREQPPLISPSSLSFNATAAYGLTRDIVTQFPMRVLGSLESRQSTGYIHDYLEKLGYSFTYTHFDTRIARRKQVGRNVLAYKQGQSDEILALVAHLDTARTTTQGAMDNGSGVGVLLELARIFATNQTRRSLLLVFSDGEEWGMLGARDLAESYPERNKIAAAVSLDHVGIGDLKALCLEETGQRMGFTPPWLRQLAHIAAESQGLPVHSASGISEYLARAFFISWADQGPFLSQGIPAINLGSESTDQAREREIYHSKLDTIENLKPDSIGTYGRAAERIVRTLDELDSIPKDHSDAFRFWGTRFVGSGPMLCLQILSFIPLVLVLVFYLQNHAAKVSLVGAGREFLAFLGTVLPFWAIFLLIGLTRALRLIPTYTLYPATLKDPVLSTPRWDALAGIAVTALFVAIVLYLIARFSFRNLPKPEFHVSKIILLALLSAGVVLALFYNPYWASLFFVLPAWIWSLAGNGKLGGHPLERMLIVAAGIPYFALLWIYASKMYLGWNFIWYQTIALSNGFFTGPAYFLATAIIAIGIRFFVIQSQERRTEPGFPS